MPWLDIRIEGARSPRFIRCSTCTGVPAYGECNHVPIVSSGQYVFAEALNACTCGTCNEWLATPVTDPAALREARNASRPMILAAVREWRISSLPDGMTLCAACEREVSADSVVSAYLNSGPETASLICAPCAGSAYSVCDVCVNEEGEDILHHRYNLTRAFDIDFNSLNVCSPCLDSFSQCRHCDSWNEGGCRDCEADDDDIVDGCRCGDCRTTSSRWIRNYSYRPNPLTFYSVGPEVIMGTNRYGSMVDKTVYMGFELEVEVPRSQDRTAIARDVTRAFDGLFYLKEDGSISHGFEMVTHPMTLDYAMTKLPWRVIRDLRKQGKAESSSGCGLHVHVSKASFSGAAHEYRWLLFWHRNQVALKRLAGRDSDYAKYDFGHRRDFKKIVKNQPAQMPRYTAINTINEHTYEVRVFASTLFVNRVQAALQLVESTAEYTRSLQSAKVMKDGGFSWGEYVAWLRTHKGRYAALLERIKAVIPDGAEMPRTTTSFDFYEYLPPPENDRWARPETVLHTLDNIVIMEGKVHA